MICYVCKEKKETNHHLWSVDDDTGLPKMGVPVCGKCYTRIMYDHEWIKPYIMKKPTTK